MSVKGDPYTGMRTATDLTVTGLTFITLPIILIAKELRRTLQS